MKITKKKAEAKEAEKLFRYARELEDIRDNMEILFKNRDELDSNENKLEERVRENDKKIKIFSRVKQIGKVITVAGGGLSVSGSTAKSVLLAIGYPEAGDTFHLIAPYIGGGLTITGSVMDFFASSKEKSYQDDKQELEIEKVKKINEKSYRDFNRLKDNWKKLDDIRERLSWLSKTTIFSEEVDSSLSEFLLKIVKFEELMEKRIEKVVVEEIKNMFLNISYTLSVLPDITELVIKMEREIEIEREKEKEREK